MSCYDEWIRDNVTEVYGKCSELTEKMLSVFPELSRVRGHYICPVWGEQEHWWLLTPNGEIVDPTAKQFPSGGVVGKYIQWKEGAPEPTGKCLQCGGYVYNHRAFCCDKCAIEYDKVRTIFQVQIMGEVIATT